MLGEHPDLKKPIKLMGGPYGPYVQLGEQDETSKKKPKRASWPKGISLPQSGDEESLVLAIKLLSLPRVLGVHPETKKQVETSIGRFGPYIKHDGAFKSIPKGETPYDISLQRALEILAQPSINGRAGKPLGQHPDDSKTVTLHKGKYGPYVKHGKINATVTSDIEPDDVTLEIALTLLAQKAVKTPKKRAAKKPSKKR